MYLQGKPICVDFLNAMKGNNFIKHQSGAYYKSITSATEVPFSLNLRLYDNIPKII
jgi:hypothetical protein